MRVQRKDDMRASVVGTLIFVSLAAARSTSAQVAADQEVRVRLTGRMQAQFSTTNVDESEIGADAAVVAASMFETRRVRLAADISIREWITGIVEPDFAAGDIQLRHAYMNLAFSPALQVRAGQFKKPFSRLLLESSLQILPIERGVRIRGLSEALSAADAASEAPVLTQFAGRPLMGEEQALLDAFGYQGYDLGAQLHGVRGRLTYAIGVFNGAGANRRDENDGMSAAARVTYALRSSPLTLGTAIGYQERFHPSLHGTAIELDAEWGRFRAPGLRVNGEAVRGGTIVVDDAFVAGFVNAAWFHPVAGGRVEGIEPVARVSYGDPRRDVDGDAGVLLTSGINLYFFGRNRLMLNWDVYVPEGDHFATAHALRAQAQLAF